MQQQPAASCVPVFWGHGTADPVVPVAAGLQAAEHLQQMGCPLDWHDYDMPHSVCPQEIVDISQWLQEILQNN
ncbi:MAG: hypothetical protein KZQ58_04830 [gamma proteobacterium symbiont of Bathyaustriella thionipta]|nr:hypothetical protein [gamma proteobacterium symbiont of Bathyaustriella thionipta]